MKTVRALIGLLVLVAAFYTAWQLIPPYFHNYQLEDVIKDEARMNTYTNKSEEDMRETVYKKAKDMDIPLTREQIKVRRDGQSIDIAVDYNVHLDFPGYPVDLQFHPTSRNKAY